MMCGFPLREQLCAAAQRAARDESRWSTPPVLCADAERLFMLSSFVIARRLAAAMLAGGWELDELVDRGGRVLGKRWRWLRPLARRIIAAFAGQFRPAFDALAQFIDRDPGFQRACARQMESDDGILIFAAPGLGPR